VRRYRPSRSWPVAGLALLAAAGAVMTTGALSSALEDRPGPAIEARIGPGVVDAQRGAETRAAMSAQIPPAGSPSATPPVGPWQIQVGAFRNTISAETHLRALEGDVPELARLSAIHQIRGGVTRVRIAGIGDEAAARGLCEQIASAGRGCFVVRPEG
jgi:hypothetical protein